MTRLTQLPEVAQECLGGLTADERLYQKILHGGPAPVKRVRPMTRALAFAFSLVFLLGIGALSMNFWNIGGVPSLRTQTAGGLPEGGQQAAFDVPRGSITLAGQGVVPKYVGVWAHGSGGNFPLVRVDGRYYRLLQNPTSIGNNLLGSVVGTVGVYTDEPSLDTQVYALSGMGGSAVAGQVDGALRVFQRVSYSGNALVGGEGLADTLRGSVTGLQLSGVGSITDQGTVDSLMNKLLSSGYQGASGRATDQALLIRYDNGIVLQMALRDSRLSACGSWDAGEFLEAFKAAVE